MKIMNGLVVPGNYRFIRWQFFTIKKAANESNL